MNSKIFIQIASYRDPELLPTLRDCISKSKFPENLVFSIAWQHTKEDEWDNLDEFKDDPRFKIIDIDYKESKGACWARNTLQQQYAEEQYTLQLDSHHRFVDNWDEELINMYEGLRSKGYEKPLITSYISSYNPETDPDGRTMVPWKMNFDRFIPEGAVFFLPASIDNHKELTEPIPARFYSAHFAFAAGSFVKEVPHDPEYYFHGEEISIAVRAYTWGYDLLDVRYANRIDDPDRMSDEYRLGVIDCILSLRRYERASGFGWEDPNPRFSIPIKDQLELEL